jgi:N-methylhydantoinase B
MPAVAEHPEQDRTLDGVRAAVLTSRLDGIVRAMANTLLRTARSGIINTAHDFSCCILTTDPALLAMAQSLPIHVMCGPDVTCGVMARYHPDLRNGDAFLHNSPYEGNSHAADHAILVPVLDETGRHRFTVYAKGHQADCGNSLATTYMAAARDVYEEGALIFPMVKVQEDYRDNDDVIRMCEARIRAPEQWHGDYLALVGAARIGERKLRELAREFGWDALRDYARGWFDYSEGLMAQAIGRLPAGQIEVETRHDPFPEIPDGVALRARVAVDPVARVIDIDLRDNPDCLPCGLNLTEATAKTAVMIAVFNSLPDEVPHNGGSLRRVRVHLREGCCVGVPRHPVSCSVATTGLANRIGAAVQRGIAALAPGIGMAESGVILNPALGVISGIDPRDGRAFVNQLMLGHAGGPASPGHDGWLTIGDHGAGGVVLIDSVEMDELQYPIVVHRRRVETDAEGPGRQRGAPGSLVEYGPLGCDLTVLYASDGSFFPAQGAAGGGPGCLASQWKVAPGGEREDLPVFGEIRVADGETVCAVTSGGGGYGDPATRAVDAVAADVREGWVSRARARDVYRVVCDGSGVVDERATAELRAARDAA